MTVGAEGCPIISETEQKMMVLWREVLKLDDLTVNDDFVDLGGDSIAAMQCISRLKNAFGVEFGIEEFFLGGATISAFAAAVDASRSPNGNIA